MDSKNDDLWLDHILAKATWPEPSDDLHARIMQRATYDVLPATRREQMRWAAMAAAFVMAGFITGSLYTSSATTQSSGADAAYYSDSNFEYSNFLGS